MAENPSPLSNYSFYIELDGIAEGTFRECSGLSSESEIIEHRESTKDGKPIIVKVPGAIKWSNIILKRGMSDSTNLWEWRKMIEDGKVDEARKNGSIVLYDAANKEVARYNFERGWPSRWKGPDIAAHSSEIAIEEIEIVHEGLSRGKK